MSFKAVLLVAVLAGSNSTLAQEKPPSDQPDPDLTPLVGAPPKDDAVETADAPDPTPAASTEAMPELAPAPRQPVFSLMPKVGGVFPQVLNRLESSFSVALELSYITPLFGSRLAVTAEVSYSQPLHKRTVDDPRVAEGAATYTIRQQTLGIYGGPRFYFLPLTSKVLAYVGVGLRGQLLADRVDGRSGTAEFGHHDETGTHLAWGGQLGFGYEVGPGHLALELQMISSPINHLVTGGVNVGDLTVRAGYLIHF